MGIESLGSEPKRRKLNEDGVDGAQRPDPSRTLQGVDASSATQPPATSMDIELSGDLADAGSSVVQLQPTMADARVPPANDPAGLQGATTSVDAMEVDQPIDSAPGNDASMASGVDELDLPGRAATRKRDRDGTHKPLSEASLLIELISRAQWLSELNGKNVPRKIDEEEMDLRHVIAYETMQKAFKNALMGAKNLGELDGHLRNLWNALHKNSDSPQPPLQPEQRTDIVETVNRALFNCRGNFFLGPALMNQRLGSATGALGRTEGANRNVVDDAGTLRQLSTVIQKAIGSLSGPVFSAFYRAYSPDSAISSGDAEIAKTTKSRETLARNMLESLPGANTPTSAGRITTEYKHQIQEIIESLRDTTAFDVSQAADPDLKKIHNALAGLFLLFRNAEQHSDLEVFVAAATAMFEIDDLAVELKKRKDSTWAALYAIPPEKPFRG